MSELTQAQLEDWILNQATGKFHYTKVLDGQVDPKLYPSVRVMLRRAKDKGVAVPVDGNDGWWRPVDESYEEIILDGQDVKEEPLKLPMEMQKYGYIFTPALILVSGEWNKGKTAFLFDCACLNCEQYRTVLYVSEGAELMKLRIKNKYGYIPNPMPFKMRKKTSNFADIIKPNDFDLFIIDYLRPNMEKSYAVTNELKAIYDNLGKIAIVAMQKPTGRDIAYGGEATQWEPMLSIAIGNGYARFTKIKVPKIFNPDPYKTKFTFQIVKGVNFTNVSTVVE